MQLRRKHADSADGLQNEQVDKKPKTQTGSQISLFDNFKQGDLVYGLIGPRAEIIKSLKEKGFNHLYTNALNNDVVEMVVDDTTDGYEKLCGPKKENYQLLKKYRDYLCRQGGRPVPVMQYNPIHGAAYRRACKLLLINREENRNYAAHVLTEGIEWERVCDKKQSKLGVTDSELRAAYRDFKKNGPNPHIFFYDSKNTLMNQPPWNQPDQAKGWQQYEEELKQKNVETPSIAKK